MGPFSLTATGGTAAPSPSPRLMTAARQFEALLLESLLGPAERTFSTVPGGSNQAESETYQSLGVEALANGLACSGGLGIAAMIVRNLMKSKGIERPGEADTKAKVSLTEADR
jgi:Rod binding domain-containing protein